MESRSNSGPWPLMPCSTMLSSSPVNAVKCAPGGATAVLFSAAAARTYVPRRWPPSRSPHQRCPFAQGTAAVTAVEDHDLAPCPAVQEQSRIRLYQTAVYIRCGSEPMSAKWNSPRLGSTGPCRRSTAITCPSLPGQPQRRDPGCPCSRRDPSPPRNSRNTIPSALVAKRTGQDGQVIERNRVRLAPDSGLSRSRPHATANIRQSGHAAPIPEGGRWLQRCPSRSHRGSR